MKGKRFLFILMMLTGVVLLLLGTLVFTSEETKMVSGICFGLSTSIFGLGIGWLIRSFTVSPMKEAEINKKKEIEVNDERNTRIREKTGYMVAKIMNYILSIFILSLGFMRADIKIILAAVTMLAIEFILVIYYSNYFSKRI